MAHLPNDIKFRAEILISDMRSLAADYHTRSDQWEALQQEIWAVEQSIEAIVQDDLSKRRKSVLLDTSLEPKFPELCKRLRSLFSAIDDVLRPLQ